MEKKKIKDDKKLVATYLYGIQSGKEFILYTPNAPLSEMPERVLLWWSSIEEHRSEPYQILSCYAIVNKETNEVFLFEPNNFVALFKLLCYNYWRKPAFLNDGGLSLTDKFRALPFKT